MFRFVEHVLRNFLEAPRFQNFITFIIILNSILIGLETYPEIVRDYEAVIDAFDMVILVVFTIEIALKIAIYRKNFFTNGWNVFDFLVVGVSILPAAGSFSIFRALRIIRALRLLKSLPKLRLIIESLLHSLPSIGWIVVLLAIVYYIYAVVGYNLFSAGYPEYFGSLEKAVFTLFQIMTLESWSSAIARPIMDGIPYAAIYFVTFILIATYTTLNVFIAIVVNTMNQLAMAGMREEEEHMKQFIAQQNKLLHRRLDQLESKMNQEKS